MADDAEHPLRELPPVDTRCLEDNIIHTVHACIHAGTGIASVRTKKLDIPACAENLVEFGGEYMKRLGMIYLRFGKSCKVMIFPTSIKLRCLEEHDTVREREEAVTEVMAVVSENLACD